MATKPADLFEELEKLNDGSTESRAGARNRTRGLPDEKARRELAETYLTTQHRLWPALLANGTLPKNTPDVVGQMAENFRKSFEAAEWSQFADLRGMKLTYTIGGVYLRYSDDNSNSRSLDQQLVNNLEAAHKLNVFIPWQYVFADAAISGTTAARRGYQLVQNVIESKTAGADSIHIDELGRANRDMVEALRLARLVKFHGKRMIGASDGYVSDSPSGKMQLFFYAMFNDFFVDQLRAKVLRGMKDAFARGKNLGKPSFGYKLTAVLRADGTVLLDDENCAVTERVIDEELMHEVLFAMIQFADHSRSCGWLAKNFNRRKVGGRDTWTGGSIAQLLKRELYRGIEFYGMTYHLKDPTTGKVTVKQRPKSDWQRREVPEMRIVPDDLWERVQARIALIKAAHAKSKSADKPSRTELYPKTLVRPFCSGCKKPMSLGRAGKYASYFCDNGREGKKSCEFRGYKSAKIIDTVILNRVAGELFTEGFLAKVVEEANRCISELPDHVVPTERDAIVKDLRKKQHKLETLKRALDDSDEDAGDLKVIYKIVAELQRMIDDAKARLAEIDKPAVAAPRLITIEEVLPLIDDLRMLLTDDIGAAAPVLAKVTGNVLVSREPMEKGGKLEWKGHFKLNAVPIFLFLATRRHCPTANTWEFLSTRRWTIGERVEVWLRQPLKHELISAEVKALADKDMAINAIALKLRTSWTVVRAALDYANAGGTVPMVLLPKMPQKGRPMAAEVVTEVVRLRDEEHLSFVKIGAKLGIDNTTASRAYDGGKGSTDHQPYKRGTYHILPKRVFDTIESMLDSGDSDETIAAAACCSVNTVKRHKKKLAK